MAKNTLVIGIVAGEVSGDILGAGLMRALKKRHPDARFLGVAGSLMQKEGCESWFDMEELAVMGITEVVKRLPRILQIRKKITQRFLQLKPDVFIGIDAPDFNLTLEHNLKKHGIKTVHYVSPSVWAWREKRIFKIAQATELVLSLLPFEKKIYDKYKVPCRFVGHTAADNMPLNPSKSLSRERLGIKNDLTCLALLPGSRMNEIEALSADFLQAAQLVKSKHEKLKIVVPLISQQVKQQFLAIKKQFAPELPVTIITVGNAQQVLVASDVALLASGTASLESMLAKCPMVVGYKLKPLTFWLAKKLIKVPYVALPNLLANKPLVPEFLQDDCTPEKLATALNHLLTDQKQIKQLKHEFTELHKQLRCQADEKAAEAVLELIYA